MKCTIPEISWHNRDPVLSIDVQPKLNEDIYRLASGGTDTHVLIWHLNITNNGSVVQEPVADLTRHQKAVNVVRWSHSGQYLASGDDDANIIIWHQKSDDFAVMVDGDNDDKEKWTLFKVLRGHKEDVYDIAWSPDSSKLISGSVDNTAIIWDLSKGLNDNILTEHKGFVQGVSWDPLGNFIVTLSSDRICRIFNTTGKQIKARIFKGQIPVPEGHSLHNKIVRYYHDDTLKSFFRRLTFSPDGNLILTPAGCLENEENKLYVSYIFTINSPNQPVAILPSPGQYTVAIRCCPVLFQLRLDGPDPVVDLPYRMIFAVATRSSVVLYDTQQMSPFAVISNIHYTRLTDIAWSIDGRLLVVSSTDGFCSLVTFEPNELGLEYIKKIDEPEPMDLDEPIEILEESFDASIEEKKEKRPSFLEKWAKLANDSTKMDTDDVICIDSEKENTNITPNKIVIDSDKEIAKTSKSQRNTPAKPIAVRRTPRTDQMDITRFLTPSKIIKQTEEIENTSNTITKNVKKSDPTTSATLLTNIDNAIIEISNDSDQKTKLILNECTNKFPIIKLEKINIEKIKENNDNLTKKTEEISTSLNKITNNTISISDDDNGNLTKKSKETNTSPNKITNDTILISDDVNLTKNSEELNTSPNKITNDTISISDDVNITKNSEELNTFPNKITNDTISISDDDNDNLTKKSEEINTFPNNKITNDTISINDNKNKLNDNLEIKCDTNMLPKVSLLPEVTEIKKSVSISKDSPAKKRVNFITLSSPKHKKK